MSIQEIVAGSGSILVVLMTLIQFAPLKINPWSAIGRSLGRGFNDDVIEQLDGRIWRAGKAGHVF